jgi:hypothetical protein
MCTRGPYQGARCCASRHSESGASTRFTRLIRKGLQSKRATSSLLIKSNQFIQWSNNHARSQVGPIGVHAAMLLKKNNRFIQWSNNCACSQVGPIGVHAAMLLILAGTAYSGIGGFKGSAMIPEVSGSVVLPHWSA